MFFLANNLNIIPTQAHTFWVGRFCWFVNRRLIAGLIFSLRCSAWISWASLSNWNYGSQTIRPSRESDTSTIWWLPRRWRSCWKKTPRNAGWQSRTYCPCSMKSEGFFYVSGYRREKTLKKLSKNSQKHPKTYKNSHRGPPNLQKLSQDPSELTKTLKNSHGKSRVLSRFRKKLSKPSKNSQKTLKNSHLLVSAWNRVTFAYAVPLTRELKCQDLEKLSKNSQKLSKKPPFSAKNSQKLSKKGQNST